MIETNKSISIYLIDDQAMIRSAFRALLEKIDGYRVVGDNRDARSGIDEIKQLKPDIVLLDITMPGLSGLDAVEPIKRASPHTKVLMASTHEGGKFVQQSLQAGADGYISKDSDPDELRLAIDSILSGEAYLSPRVAGALVSKMRGDKTDPQPGSELDRLTPREREVFQLIALGRHNKQIAQTLHLSLGTVKKHRENLQRKLDVHSAAEIARIAIREGLLNA
jgi:DNA-binding NarL/FixJ family response regulator